MTWFCFLNFFTGCCWAMESIIHIKTGKLISLSEQQLVDCSKNDGGCNGGWMYDAYQYIIRSQGLTRRAGDKVKEHQQAAKIRNYITLPTKQAAALKAAVDNQPVSVSSDSSAQSFKFYKGDIYDGPCGTNVDHSVAVVGYETDGERTKYWIIKNSWVENWGENGCMRIKRDVAAVEGLCGLAIEAYYPFA